jgi:hypothetical protein
MSYPDTEPEQLETISDTLTDAALDRATVTILRTDGRLFTGTLRPHATDPQRYTLQTGGRGRPPVIHADDVEDVIYE